MRYLIDWTRFCVTVWWQKSSPLWLQTMAKFNAPVIQDNPSGWGPCAVPEKFKDMPYQPFSKGDRLGKVCVSDITTWYMFEPEEPNRLQFFDTMFSSCCVFLLSGGWLDWSHLSRQEIHKWVGQLFTQMCHMLHLPFSAFYGNVRIIWTQLVG